MPIRIGRASHCRSWISRNSVSDQPVPIARVQVWNRGHARGRELPDHHAVLAWDALEPHVDWHLRCLDTPHLLHIRGQAIIEEPCCAVAQAVDIDRDLLVQDDLQVTSQLRSQALRRLSGEASQVEIFGSPPVVVGAGRPPEPLHRSTRRAAVQVVDRDARRDLSRLTTRLVLLCPDGLVMGRLPPAGAPGEPE
jgi:hypothetical protein